jgi:DNA-binding transcriptional LysR family regulator
MDIHHLRVFRAAALNKSFTRAADALRLSQSTVSLHIKHLEEELDCSLFLRVGKRIVLSPAGELLMERSDRILTELKNAEMAVREVNSVQRGTVRFGTGLTTLVYRLPPALYAYKRKFPKIELFVEFGTTEFLIDDIQQHRLDLAIVMLPVSQGGIRVVPLGDEELVIVVHKHHPLSRRPEIAPDDLASLPFILYESHTAMQTLIDNYSRSLGVELLVTMRMESPEAIKALVRSGLGASILPVGAVSIVTRADSLRVLRVKGRPLFRQLAVITLDANPLPNAIRELEKHLVNALNAVSSASGIAIPPST